MPIPSQDEMVLKAEIKAALFQKAFEALAVEMAHRDRNAFAAAVARIRPMLDGFSVSGFQPSNRDVYSTDDIRRMQYEALQEALEFFTASAIRIDRKARK